LENGTPGTFRGVAELCHCDAIQRHKIGLKARCRISKTQFGFNGSTYFCLTQKNLKISHLCRSSKTPNDLSKAVRLIFYIITSNLISIGIGLSLSTDQSAGLIFLDDDFSSDITHLGVIMRFD
jgi:hypothetical protein